jgi:hypothetical protein
MPKTLTKRCRKSNRVYPIKRNGQRKKWRNFEEMKSAIGMLE